MLLLREPNVADIRNYIMLQSRQSLSYRERGITRSDNVPDGFNQDRGRVLLGAGEDAWRLARSALETWRMFATDWTRLCWPYKRLEPGIIFGVVALHYGFWSLNACRIIYVIDERTPVRRFGFAHGTVGGHLLRGEERFTVEWLEDDTVWYELYAVSQPRRRVARFGYPIVRRLQQRFRRDSMNAMLKAASSPRRLMSLTRAEE